MPTKDFQHSKLSSKDLGSWENFQIPKPPLLLEMERVRLEYQNKPLEERAEIAREVFKEAGFDMGE